MTTLELRVSNRSLNFDNQRKAYLLRTVKHESFESIASQVFNLQKEHPAWSTVRGVINKIDKTNGHRKYKYHKCGRRPWKMTSEVQRYVIRRLLALRATDIVTSVSLQADLAREKGITVDDATVRSC